MVGPLARAPDEADWPGAPGWKARGWAGLEGGVACGFAWSALRPVGAGLVFVGLGLAVAAEFVGTAVCAALGCAGLIELVLAGRCLTGAV